MKYKLKQGESFLIEDSDGRVVNFPDDIDGKQDVISDLEEIRGNAQDGAEADVKITAAQTKIGWIDEFEWTDEQDWPEESGGDEPVVGDTLRTMPTLRVSGSYKSESLGIAPHIIHVYHPMMNQDNAEIVLLRYSKKNAKLRLDDNDGPVRTQKKGYGLASGPSHSEYFIFSAETSFGDFADFCDNNLAGQNLKRHFGIALRIPNPDYNGPSTLLKNAIYKSVPESLYSDVLEVHITYDGTYDTWGIGIK